MTTIVATPDAIYADSNCTHYNQFQTYKLAHIECDKDGTDYLVAGAGDLVEFQFLCNMIKEFGIVESWKMHFQEEWPPRILKRMDTEVLIVTRDGDIMMMDKDLIPVRIDEPYYCIGSGQDYAVAALDHGDTPVQAIEYACTRDQYSKAPIHTLEFPDA